MIHLGFFVMFETILIVGLLIRLMTLPQMLKSPLSNLVIGISLSMIWSLLIDADRIILLSMDLFGPLLDYPVRALLYRTPILIGAALSLAELWRAHGKRRREHHRGSGGSLGGGGSDGPIQHLGGGEDPSDKTRITRADRCEQGGTLPGAARPFGIAPQFTGTLFAAQSISEKIR